MTNPLKWPRPGSNVPSHDHDAADIVSGTIATARLGTGTADSTTFLRGDQTYATPAGGGGSGTLPYPDEPPASPSAFDDEFRTSSLDAKWTQVETPDGSFTIDPDYLGDWLSLSGPGHATARTFGLRQALSGFAAGTAFSMTARVSTTDIQLGTVDTAIIVSNNSTIVTNNYFMVYLRSSTGTLTANGFVDGGAAGAVTLPTGHGAWYLHFQRNTSNVVRVYVGASIPGLRHFHTSTRAWNADYLYTRMVADSTVNRHSQHLIDWVRVGWLFLPAP